jgi:predicted alpha-1,2-mannosidase
VNFIGGGTPHNFNIRMYAMKTIKIIAMILSLLTAAPALAEEPVDYVNPLIGTEGVLSISLYGGMNPSVTRPFGMIQWTAMTNQNRIGQCPYRFRDKKIIGFLGFRQPAVAMGDYGAVSLMPGTGQVEHRFSERGIKYSHKDEVTTPYYYKVDFGGFRAELAAHERSSIMRFKFPDRDNPHLIVDASRDPGFPGHVKIDLENGRVTGWNTDRDSHTLGPPLPKFKGYFVIEFDAPMTGGGIYSGDTVSDGATEGSGDILGAYVTFPAGSREVMARIGTSLISLEQAGSNLRTEVPGWDLEALKNSTRQAWNEQLSRIKVQGQDGDMLVIFYTAMYHAHLYPRIFSEYGSYYSAFDDQVHEGVSYNDYSLWDTFRAEHPLLIFTATERVADMVTSLLQSYREGGWLPKWPNPTYSGIMIGSHADPMIADAWVKGIRDFDLDLAYEATRHNALDPPDGDREKRWGDRDPWTSVESRGGLSWYLELGYIPVDKTAEAVSRTLEFAYDDFCVAQLAKAAGADEDYELLMAHSKNYKNLYHDGFMRGRNEDGSWSKGGYTEGLKWHYLFMAPQDLPGLIELLGGTREVEKRLDTIFLPLIRLARYNHANEPSHHYPYLYNYVGTPWKTQREVAHALDTYYWNRPFGIYGNEDCGQMSAWYIFGSLGFYPVTPGTDVYAIGSPRWERAEIKISNPYPETTFTIIAKNQSSKNIYIQSATLNGKTLNTPFIRHHQIISGGELVFEMGPRPNRDWGTGAVLQ